MERVIAEYQKAYDRAIDIKDHMYTLMQYSVECDSVFETGVRGCISSWAFLCGLLMSGGQNKRLLMNDITECDVKDLLECASSFDRIQVSYIWKNNLEIELPHSFDITFIDTWHVYGQLKRELAKFAPMTNKYIIMHDTTVDEIYGETIRLGLNSHKQSQESGIPESEIRRGLQPAIDEFLQENPEWYVKERFTYNNGLTILARKTA